ncbi:hypothetical protein [Martelella endophytica]|nr:hypothetical protein [Martelella endophytica]
MEKLPARFFAYLVIAIGFSLVVTIITMVPTLENAKMFLIPAMLLIAWVSGPVLTHYFAPMTTRPVQRLRKR